MKTYWTKPQTGATFAELLAVVRQFGNEHDYAKLRNEWGGHLEERSNLGLYPEDDIEFYDFARIGKAAR